MKGLKTFFFMITIVLYHLKYIEGRMTFTIRDFITDTNQTNVDHSQAFQKAWKKLCEGTESPNGSMLLINENETYTLQPQMFHGPCVSSNIHIQIDGKIEAPTRPREWKNTETKSWLSFKDVNGIVLNGSGVFHAHGESWWSSIAHSQRPTSVSFMACNDIIYNGLTQMNSPNNHISIHECKNATLSNLHIIAPEDSPNTDGIDICFSRNIQVLDSSIQTGDDCVAITGGSGGSSDINITGVACGPGHGISIGSLGRHDTNDLVQNVNVRNCIFNGTQNGARIKTWHGGQGVARNILYENITLINARYPIIIDQHYNCVGSNTKENGVKVSNVTFKYFEGTSASETAIMLDCEENEKCDHIVMEHINITSSKHDKELKAYCKFADVFDYSGLFEILIILVLLIASSNFQYGDAQMTLSIKDFLSNSNETNVDHSKAFQDAWRALCHGGGRGRSLIIHANERYTIQPQLFLGPCTSKSLHIQIDGIVEAPTLVRDWGVRKTECWLCFEKVTGLVLTGSGQLNAHGESWWSSVAVSSRPEALRFAGCQNVLYSGITQINSPKNHISITGCTYTTLSNIHIIAPENSPNTDGIDINTSNNIHILGSTIQTGDDCIAINGGSSDINITSVTCGPGHGISVGSLGKDGANDIVQNVNVRHCTFKGTQNAARIKTWPGGRGFARNILYEDITLIGSRFPIIIDQHYCNGAHCQPITLATAVKVSYVTFKDFRGTCGDNIAIKLDCDKKIGCDNIVMDHVNITPLTPRAPLTAYCSFARVISRFVSVNVKCGFREDEPISPAPEVQPPSPPYDKPPTPPYGQAPSPMVKPPSSFFPFSYMF
ncbi:unnamed protein product [Cochlearia groenlandica]